MEINKNPKKEAVEPQVSVFDPARNAKYSVPVSMAIVYIKEAEKLKKYLLDKELILPE